MSELAHRHGSRVHKAGLGHVTAHDLRHSATSILLQHGDLATVSKAVGHANPNVTTKV